jgi:sialate O-acetylesterase
VAHILKRGEVGKFLNKVPRTRFKYAKAWIKGNTVVVFSDQVSNPVAVHFAWADNPEDANLFNKDGFPAVPFRTDTWKGITENGKFKIE